VLLHYTVRFVIEEQARAGRQYDSGSPYESSQLQAEIDARRFPLFSQAYGDLFPQDMTAAFEHGLEVILAGLRTIAPVG
jgi:TetR/AcrR family tetracycline transcriptional repressor